MKTVIRIYTLVLVALLASCTNFSEFSKDEQNKKICKNVVEYIKESKEPICIDFVKAVERNITTYEFNYPWIMDDEHKNAFPFIGIYDIGTARIEAFMNNSISYYKIGHSQFSIKFAINFKYDTLTGVISNPVGFIEYQNAPQPKDSVHYVTLTNGQLFSDYLK